MEKEKTYEMTNNEFDILRKIQLELLVEFARICEKHNLKYVLAFGTCIGAVRHDGFIPWDDDIDVLISRKDYMKFIEIVNNDLNHDKYYFQCFENDDIAIPFAKLKRKDSQYKSINDYLPEDKQGIWIDIFPYDNLINDGLRGTLHFYLTMMNHLQLYDKYNQNPSLDSIGKRVLFFLIRFKNIFISLPRLKKRINKLHNKYNSISTEYVTNYDCNCGSIVKRNIWKKESLEKRVLHKFENQMCYIPKEYDAILTKSYGNYMELPPEEDRHPTHHLEKLKFPKEYK